jgi:multiple sugar transport system ATP-binding protein
MGVSPAEAGGIGTVIRVEHLGDQSHLHVEAGGHRLVTLVEAHTRLVPGDRVDLSFERPLFFDADGRRVRVEHETVRSLDAMPCT